MLPRTCSRVLRVPLQRLLRHGVVSDASCRMNALAEGDYNALHHEHGFSSEQPISQKSSVTGSLSTHQGMGTGRCSAAAQPISHLAVEATTLVAIRDWAFRRKQFSSAAGQESADDLVQMTAAAVKRLHELTASAASSGETCLRLTVEAGGCSGFSYQFVLDEGPTEDDRVFEYGGAKLIVDSVSYQLVRGATVDFADELIKSTFEVVANPNAGGSCGCGSSFTLKDV